MTFRSLGSALVASLALVLASATTARAQDPAADGGSMTRVESFPVNQQGSSGTMDVYLPAAGSFARPVVVICHGWLAPSSLYSGIAKHLASRGFAAVLFEQSNWWSADTQSWANQTKDVISELARLDGDPSSALYGELDTDHVGIMGHSRGGACVTMLAGQDSRVKCCVGLAPVNQYTYYDCVAAASKITAPYLAIVGSQDALCPDLYPLGFYNAAVHSAEREVVEIAGGGHMDYVDGASGGVTAARYYTAWLERFLMGKDDPSGWTTGGMAAAQLAQGVLTVEHHAGAAPAFVPSTQGPPASSGGVLQLGSTGPDVSALQQKLVDLGYLTGGVDGDFGPKTQAAVVAFQKAKGLGADGIVGPRTRAALGL